MFALNFFFRLGFFFVKFSVELFELLQIVLMKLINSNMTCFCNDLNCVQGALSGHVVLSRGFLPAMTSLLCPL